MNLTFSHALRALLCVRCRAIVHVTAEGGNGDCKACGLPSEFASRAQCSVLKASDDTSETEQRERLRPQQGDRLEIPASLANLVHDDPMAPDYEPDELQRAFKAWDAARDDILREGATEQQFYFLTVSLQRELFRSDDEQMLRALLETAIETVIEIVIEIFATPRHVEVALQVWWTSTKTAPGSSTARPWSRWLPTWGSVAGRTIPRRRACISRTSTRW